MKKLIPPSIASTDNGGVALTAEMEAWFIEVTNRLNKITNPSSKVDPEESYFAYTGRRPIFPVDEKKTAKKTDKKSA